MCFCSITTWQTVQSIYPKFSIVYELSIYNMYTCVHSEISTLVLCHGEVHSMYAWHPLAYYIHVHPRGYSSQVNILNIRTSRSCENYLNQTKERVHVWVHLECIRQSTCWFHTEMLISSKPKLYYVSHMHEWLPWILTGHSFP